MGPNRDDLKRAVRNKMESLRFKKHQLQVNYSIYSDGGKNCKKATDRYFREVKKVDQRLIELWHKLVFLAK